MDWMDEVIASRRRVSISAAAVHLVMVAQHDAQTREAVREMVTVPDGQPLVWALRALGHSNASRIYGPELMARYCERAGESGVRMYLYGGRNQGALVQLVLNLRNGFPGSRSPVATRRRFVPRPRRSATPSPPRSMPRAPTSCGSAPASPSRRTGWRTCATASSPDPRRRRRGVRLPRGPGATGSELDADLRPGVDLPPGARTAASMAPLRALQPALRSGVRPPVAPPQPRRHRQRIVFPRCSPTSRSSA